MTKNKVIVYDEELIALLRAGNEDAERELYKRYSRSARKVARDYLKSSFLVGISCDDLYSVAFSAVKKALDNFNNLESSFYPYWKTIVLNEFQVFVKENTIGKYQDTQTISLDSFSNDDFSLSETIGEVDKSINFKILENELMEIVYSKKAGLNDIEKKIVGLRIIGETPKEIARELNLSLRQTYYILEKIKDKLSLITRNSYYD